MIVKTSIGVGIDAAFVSNYFRYLVNQIFKILPMREENEASLNIYIESLMTELLGEKAFVESLNNDARLVQLLGILQYLTDNPDCSVKKTKREVFKAITICNKISDGFNDRVNGGDSNG